MSGLLAASNVAAAAFIQIWRFVHPYEFCANLINRGIATRHRIPHLCGLDESLFQDFSTAIWAFRRGLQNVVRHARIGAGNAVENVIERNFDAFRIAMLTGYDQMLGFVQSRRVDEDHVLLFGS